jgi:transposase
VSLLPAQPLSHRNLKPPLTQTIEHPRLRRKISQLEEAFTGHHAFLLRQMLARAGAISDDIAALDIRIEAEIEPFANAAARLDEIPGINRAAAHAILAEIGPGMSRFPTAGHLVSWAKYAPGVKESAGKKKGRNSTGHGNAYLARVLGNAARAS